MLNYRDSLRHAHNLLKIRIHGGFKPYCPSLLPRQGKKPKNATPIHLHLSIKEFYRQIHIFLCNSDFIFIPFPFFCAFLLFFALIVTFKPTPTPSLSFVLAFFSPSPAFFCKNQNKQAFLPNLRGRGLLLYNYF